MAGARLLQMEQTSLILQMNQNIKDYFILFPKAGFIHNLSTFPLNSWGRDVGLLVDMKSVAQ